MLGKARIRLASRIARLGLVAAAPLQHVGSLPPLGDVVVVETDFASLLLEPNDSFITPTLIATKGWEPGETALLGERIRPAMTVYDIGAHVGYFTCLAARLVGPRGLVLAFEPDARNYELLLANVWRNGFGNVLCFPWAVGEHSGFAELHLAPENTGDHRVFASEETRATVQVRQAALDHVDAFRPPLDVVKIDVQGTEESVIRGMTGLLNLSPDVLVTCEFWPAGMELYGTSPGNALEFFRSLGFSIRVQQPDEKGLLDWSDDEILSFCRGQDDGDGHVNLVLERPA
jgi:FkbM family methyltransferase